MEICLFLNRCPCNRKKSNLKQDPKSTQPQNKFRRECHLFQNNIAVSQIKLIQQNKWRNTCKHHVARWQRRLANEVASRIELHASQITHPCLTPPLGGIPLEFLDETYPAKTRGMGLMYGENRILASTVFDWSTRVTDRRTDGRAIAYSVLSMLSCAKNWTCWEFIQWSWLQNWKLELGHGCWQVSRPTHRPSQLNSAQHVQFSVFLPNLLAVVVSCRRLIID